MEKNLENLGITLGASKEVENLPKKVKEIFVLSKTNGFTNLQISTHLGISVKTVESNITRAYKILRSKLEVYYHID